MYEILRKNWQRAAAKAVRFVNCRQEKKLQYIIDELT